MIKHTMQEIVDFFGGYGCKIDNDEMTGFFITEEKPFEVGGYKWDWYCKYITINFDFISDFETHDWRVLVEPHTGYVCPYCGADLVADPGEDDHGPHCKVCGHELSSYLWEEIFERSR